MTGLIKHLHDDHGFVVHSDEEARQTHAQLHPSEIVGGFNTFHRHDVPAAVLEYVKDYSDFEEFDR